MKKKITVIVDNTSDNAIKGEWGLSILLEYGCTKERAYRILKKELGDKLEQFRVGLVREF